MTMLERAMQEGVDPSLLVGWVETLPGRAISRLGKFIVARIESRGEKEKLRIYDGNVLIGRAENMIQAIDAAGRAAEQSGGWAPAPIGYVRDEWLPIETAPKDGQKILVFRPKRNGDGSVDLAYWDDQKYHKKPFPFWNSCLHHGILWCRDYPPTHWRPLPIPPKEVG